MSTFLYRSLLHQLQRSVRSIPKSRSVHWQPNHHPILAEYDAAQIARMKQREADQDARRKRQKIEHEHKPLQEGSNEEVLQFDIHELLKRQTRASNGVETNPGEPKLSGPDLRFSDALPEPFSEIELTISDLSSTGDGLALSPSSDHVYVVPFAIPGDSVIAKVTKHFRRASYSLTDFVRVLKPSDQRDDSRIKCQYFAKCSGCLLQMLPYEAQLQHKKTIIEKAYRNFSGLNPSLIPSIEDTIGSPRQYGYRTKLNPHFDGLPGMGRGRKHKGKDPKYEEVPPIGFTIKGMRRVMDIEDCQIATDIVRKGLTAERRRIARELSTFKNGATLLLRESTERIPKIAEVQSNPLDGDDEDRHVNDKPDNLKDDGQDIVIRQELDNFVEEKRCITDQNGASVEYVDDFIFQYKAGAFFQNNNSILSKFTAYIRERILPAKRPSEKRPVKYLLDAYSGSGLFTITLSSLFKSSLGIDIAEPSIKAARFNATANNVLNAGFVTADASALFAGIPYPSEQTVVVVDPPRKGCDENFLQQLLRYGPLRVVYVSCNVHSQARDVGILVKGDDNWKYGIESITGFDFFPQTGHVEGVAILNRLKQEVLNSQKMNMFL